MKESRFQEAIIETLIEEMTHDPRMSFFECRSGEYSGPLAAALAPRFGETRVRSIQGCADGMSAAALGSAIAGRPTLLSFDAASSFLTASGNLLTVLAQVNALIAQRLQIPLVVQIPQSSASDLEQYAEGVLQQAEGLIIAAPSRGTDARSLLSRLLKGSRPAVFMQPDEDCSSDAEAAKEEFPIGSARLSKPGRDATLVSWSSGTAAAEEAASQLAADGIDAEVIDLRTLQPLDESLLLTSIQKTHRVFIAAAGPGQAFANALSQLIYTKAFDELDAPVEILRADHCGAFRRGREYAARVKAVLTNSSKV